MIERLLQDLRYAARTFRRAPGFLLLTVLTIAVGVGANAAIFSIVNAVLLRPLPFRAPDELVLVTDVEPRRRGRATATRRRRTSSTGARGSTASPRWRRSARRRSRCPAATGRSASPARSSTPTSSTCSTSSRRSAARFDGGGRRAGRARASPCSATGSGGSGSARGRTRSARRVRLNDEPHTIVGVMPPGIDYPDRSRVVGAAALARAGRSAARRRRSRRRSAATAISRSLGAAAARRRRSTARRPTWTRSR